MPVVAVCGAKLQAAVCSPKLQAADLELAALFGPALASGTSAQQAPCGTQHQMSHQMNYLHLSDLEKASSTLQPTTSTILALINSGKPGLLVHSPGVPGQYPRIIGATSADGRSGCSQRAQAEQAECSTC